MDSFKLLLVVVFITQCICYRTAKAFTPLNNHGRILISRAGDTTTSITSSRDGEDQDEKEDRQVNQYLDKASKLRKEVEELEAKMRRNDDNNTSAATTTTTVDKKTIETLQQKTPTYKSLDDSTWMISYRFASDPVQRENDNNDDSNEDNVKLTFYSGKVYICLKADGTMTRLILSYGAGIPSKA